LNGRRFRRKADDARRELACLLVSGRAARDYLAEGQGHGNQQKRTTF
jgi:hypothetical protein